MARDAARTLLAGVPELRSPLDEAAEHVVSGFGELAPHADVEPGLRRMRDAALRVATLTNGSSASTESLLERAGLSDLVERCLDVADAGRWKPAPEPYRLACRTLGVEPAEAVLIAAHAWDVHGAKRAGLRGAWLDGRGDPYPKVFEAPDATASDLSGLVGELSNCLDVAHGG